MQGACHVRHVESDVRGKAIVLTEGAEHQLQHIQRIVFKAAPIIRCRLAAGQLQHHGIDGLILPDLPYEEKNEFLPICRKYGVDLISMIAPTSENRIAMIAKEAEGFLYIVSSLGVTGTRSEIKTDLASIVKVVRENAAVPCAIGFGISTPEQAAKMAGIADGAIVGSAVIKLLEQYGKDAPEQIGAYVKRMKDAVRG